MSSRAKVLARRSAELSPVSLCVRIALTWKARSVCRGAALIWEQVPAAWPLSRLRPATTTAAALQQLPPATRPTSADQVGPTIHFFFFSSLRLH